MAENNTKDTKDTELVDGNPVTRFMANQLKTVFEDRTYTTSELAEIESQGKKFLNLLVKSMVDNLLTMFKVLMLEETVQFNLLKVAVLLSFLNFQTLVVVAL